MLELNETILVIGDALADGILSLVCGNRRQRKALAGAHLVVLNSKVEEVVEQIKSWPTETRIALARRVLETLEVGSGVSPAGFKGPAAQQVLGLWSPSGCEAPTDSQCDDILADELRRKHAS